MNKIKQPIDNIEWVDRELLKPNNYNPNSMGKYEMKLLIISILEDGWTQPIIRNQNNDIVDGYHRWLASDNKKIRTRDNGKVPVTTTNPTDPISQQMSTIRHNRAKKVLMVFLKCLV
jgi:ParB-like chromosome segregation protein Spo0J